MDQQTKYSGLGPLPRNHGFDADEASAIVVGGELVPVGTPVRKWYEPGGFDQYQRNKARVVEEDRRTGKVTERWVTGARFGARAPRGLGGIRQVFLHHTGGDGDGARNVFETLHNQRKLSVHFVVDDTGFAWQFLDVAECAWHGGAHNGCSVGIECCLYPDAEENPDYYSGARNARTHNLPHRTVRDVIHGRARTVFAFTDPQVEATARIAAGVWYALSRANRGTSATFAEPPRFPRDPSGNIPRTVVPNALQHVGLMGHLQATINKWDPAGFPWESFEGRVAGLFGGMRAQ